MLDSLNLVATHSVVKLFDSYRLQEDGLPFENGTVYCNHSGTNTVLSTSSHSGMEQLCGDLEFF